MSNGVVHVIGAGIAGLSAAVALARQGERVVVHEATNIAGGRCRSYHDPAIDMLIDNGNHLLLSGNRAARDYLRTIGTEDHLVGPRESEFHFADLADGKRWSLKFGKGRIPWWIFDRKSRVPDTRARDYLSILRLLRPARGKCIGEVIGTEGAFYERLLRPLLLAALNIEPQHGSARLAAAVIRETLAAGGEACRPLIARDGLGPAFIAPALAFVRARGGEVRLGDRLQAFGFSATARKVDLLEFEDERVALADGDTVVLAVPPNAATALLPDLTAPNEFHAIVNAHFRVAPATNQPALLGVLNGVTEWIFAFPQRLSVTISAADRLLDTAREDLARMIWSEVASVVGRSKAPLPKWQIVRERRATFAATPAEDAKRPQATTAWSNLFVAGDWTDTGLPATIEGATRSGQRAAALIVKQRV